MTALQKVNLGTAPAGTDGDPVRTGFAKANANIDVLNTQAALATGPLITASGSTLGASHIGRRIFILLDTTGTVYFPAASSCEPDQVIQLCNAGSGAAELLAQPGDWIAFSMLPPGESVLFDTDGVTSWRCVIRGRTTSDDETVNGTLTANGDIVANGAISIRRTSGEGDLRIGQNDGYFYGSPKAAGWWSPTNGSFAYTFSTQTFGVPNLSVAGDATFGKRPTFGGATPWDSANMPSSGFVHSNSQNLILQYWDPSTLCLRVTVDGTGFQGSLVTGINNGFHLTWVGGAVGLYVDSTSLGNITTSSDYRAKQNVMPIATSSWDAVKKLRPVTYEWKDFDIFEADGERHAGFIAHEVQEVIPSGATGKKDGVDDKGNPVIQSLNWAPIVATLTAALQEAMERIEALESR